MTNEERRALKGELAQAREMLAHASEDVEVISDDMATKEN